MWCLDVYKPVEQNATSKIDVGSKKTSIVYYQTSCITPSYAMRQRGSSPSRCHWVTTESVIEFRTYYSRNERQPLDPKVILKTQNSQ